MNVCWPIILLWVRNLLFLTKFSNKSWWVLEVANSRSSCPEVGSRPEVFCKKGKPQVCNFNKKETLAQVLSCEFCEISKNTFSYRTPLMAASEVLLEANLAYRQISMIDHPQKNSIIDVCSGLDCTTSFNWAWTQALRRFKSCLRCVWDSR